MPTSTLPPLALRARGALTLLAATLALCGQTAVARADDNAVRSAIMTQETKIERSPAHRAISAIDSRRPDIAKFRRLEPELRREFLSAVGVVSRTRASSARGEVGRRDWIRGVRTFVRGLDLIIAEIRALERGDRATAKRDLDRGLAALDKGERLTSTAYRLLGI